MLGGVFGLWVGGNYGDIAEDRSYAPAAEAELQRHYKGEIGDLIVDLRQLSELDGPHDVTVEGGIGPVTVFLPGDVPVALACEEGIGETDCTPGSYNDDASGETLELRIEGGIGPVRVTVPAR